MSNRPPLPHPQELLSRHDEQQGPGNRCTYRIAGRRLVSEVPIFELASFVLDCDQVGDCGEVAPFELVADAEPPLLRDRGRAGDQMVRVSCTAAAAEYHLGVEGAGLLVVSADGCLIRHLAASYDATLLIAGLVLALSLHGTWCLHAGAAVHRGKVVAFVGDSGAGKSTLAEYLDSRSQGDWFRVADDILPITNAAASVLALPHFPQPALAQAVQHTAAGSLQLAAIYQLAPATGQRIEIEPLGEREALMTLVNHTHGAGLLGRSLLKRHLATCLALTGKLPVRRLSYERRREQLPLVATALDHDLAQS